MENSLFTQNSNFLGKGQLNIIIDHFNKISNNLIENHESLEDAIKKTQELHVDSINLLLGIINNKNQEILEGKEELSQEKINNLNVAHRYEIENLYDIIRAKDRQIYALENKIETVNNLLSNGHENYFKSILKNGSDEKIVEYELKVNSIEDIIKCANENIFSLQDLVLNGTNVEFFNNDVYSFASVNAINIIVKK